MGSVRVLRSCAVSGPPFRLVCSHSQFTSHPSESALPIQLPRLGRFFFPQHQFLNSARTLFLSYTLLSSAADHFTRISGSRIIRVLVFKMASTRQSAVPQGITTPSRPANKAHQTPKIPKTPSTLYQDNFDYTPGTQTTDSFHDSGFFSSPNGESYSHKVGYQDFVLFPEESDAAYLDTSEFFADADRAVYDHSAEAYPQNATVSPTPSYDSAPALSAYDAALDEELYNNVRLALRSCHISSPPTSPRPYKSPRMRDIDVETTTPLEMWKTSVERHEDIAYIFEQLPYPAREGFRQQSRRSSRGVRKHRSRRN